MHRAARLLGAPLAILFVLGACSGGGSKDSKADVKEDVSEQLVDQGFGGDDADCIADVIIEQIGVDKINDADFDLEEPPADLADEISAASIKALEECG